MTVSHPPDPMSPWWRYSLKCLQLLINYVYHCPHHFVPIILHADTHRSLCAILWHVLSFSADGSQDSTQALVIFYDRNYFHRWSFQSFQEEYLTKSLNRRGRGGGFSTLRNPKSSIIWRKIIRRLPYLTFWSDSWIE